MVISELGIKIPLDNPEKVTYEIKDSPGTLSTGQKYDSVITVKIKPEYLTDKSCTVGLGVFRSGEKPQYDAKEIEGKYYFVTGNPAACSPDSSNSPDDQLISSIVAKLKPSNFEAL